VPGGAAATGAQAFSSPEPMQTAPIEVPSNTIEYKMVGMKIFQDGTEVGYAGMAHGKPIAEVAQPGMAGEVAAALQADYIGLHTNFYVAQNTEDDPAVPNARVARAGEYAVDTTAFAAAGYATQQVRRAGAGASAGEEVYHRILANQEMLSLIGTDATLQAYVLKHTQEQTYKQSVFSRPKAPVTRLQSGAGKAVSKYTQARLAGALGSDLLAPKGLLH